MLNVFLSTRGHKRLVAVALAGAVVVSVFTVVFLLTFSSISESAILKDGGTYVIELSGFGTTVARVHASSPVSVCITDSGGLSLLESGQKILCYYYSKGVTDERIVWRQPYGGEFYLVIVSGSKKTEIRIDMRSGLLII